MRRFLALTTLLVLSLSRFGAPAPRHAGTWVLDRVERELGTAVPGARQAVPPARELAPRSAARAPAPWLPVHDATPLELRVAVAANDLMPASADRVPADAWHRFTYDATAPPRLSKS